MYEYVFSLWGMIIIAIVCSTLATIVGVIAKQWRKARDAENEALLKAEMIKQGRSVEDIERVLKTTGRSAHFADD
jgi:hypothetical protein